MLCVTHKFTDKNNILYRSAYSYISDTKVISCAYVHLSSFLIFNRYHSHAYIVWRSTTLFFVLVSVTRKINRIYLTHWMYYDHTIS